jgi:molybdopterin converting factor small subunit
MINIKLKLSASLLCILEDVNNAKEETYTLQVKKGTTIREVLLMEGISPLLAPMVTIENQKVDLHTALDKDETVTIFGPLAGG